MPTDIPGRIAQRCYAYGLHANTSLSPSPVSGHRSMPSELRLLFDRAFESVGPTRPSANEWVVLLKGYALRSSHLLTICSADHQHQHFAGLPCAACARAALIADTAKGTTVARAAAPPSNVIARTIGIRTPHFIHGAQPVPRTLPQSWQRLSPMPPRPPRPAPTVWWTGGIPWRLLIVACWLIFGAINTCSHPRNNASSSNAPLPAANPESLEDLRAQQALRESKDLEAYPGEEDLTPADRDWEAAAAMIKFCRNDGRWAECGRLGWGSMASLRNLAVARVRHRNRT